MQNYCECDKSLQIFNELISFLLKSYYQFIKIKGKDIKDKKSFLKMKDEYDVLISIIKSVGPKSDESITKMQDCKNDHTKETKEMISNIEKSNELESKVNYHYEKIKKDIPNLDEIEEEEDEKVGKNENNEKDKINNYEDLFKSDKPIEEMTDKEIMERDRKTIILIKNLIEDEEFKKKKNQDKKDLIKIKNQLKDIVNNIEVELNKNDEQIDNIETNVDNGFVLIEKANDENLKQTAQSAVNRRRLGYQLGLAGALGLAGTVVPGIGNIVGAALGGLIGYGIYRIDKQRLDKIEKKYSKEKEEKKNDKKKNKKK